MLLSLTYTILCCFIACTRYKCAFILYCIIYSFGFLLSIGLFVASFFIANVPGVTGFIFALISLIGSIVYSLYWMEGDNFFESSSHMIYVICIPMAYVDKFIGKAICFVWSCLKRN